MLDFSHLPTGYGSGDVQIFTGKSLIVSQHWETWVKPRGKTMCSIFMLGNGGNGGAGATGANSTAAGGGGGGSGAQTSLLIPLSMLPDQLYLSLAGSGAGAIKSSITISQNYAVGSTPVQDVLIAALGGTNGGAASGATAGTGGTAGSIQTAVSMSLGWTWANLALGGQTGGAGGTTGSAPALNQPTTGLLVTAGTGGGGLPAPAAVGTLGGNINLSGMLPVHGNLGAISTATTPSINGVGGIQPIPKLGYWYGGTGGSSTHGSATGAGLVQANGGHGAYGCGGGGSGGALTGSAAGAPGKGGAALCIIVCW